MFSLSEQQEQLIIDEEDEKILEKSRAFEEQDQIIDDFEKEGAMIEDKDRNPIIELEENK